MDDHGNICGEVGKTIGMSGRSYYIRHLTFVLRVRGKNSIPLVYVGYLHGLNSKQVPLALAGQALRCRSLPLGPRDFSMLPLELAIHSWKFKIRLN